MAIDNRGPVGVSILMLFTILVVIGCSVPPASQTDGKLPPAQSEATVEFMALDSSNLQPEDFDTAYEMCERFLRESYYAQKDPSEIDLSRYIVDPNLLKYAAKKVEKEVRRNSEIAEMSISLAKSEYQGDRFFLHLNAQVRMTYGGQFGEGTQFVVRNSDGRLIIADWYTEKGRSAFDRPRDPQRITNPTVWEDPEQVKDLFEKVGIQYDPNSLGDPSEVEVFSLKVQPDDHGAVKTIKVYFQARLDGDYDTWRSTLLEVPTPATEDKIGRAHV